jgi:GRAS domain family
MAAAINAIAFEGPDRVERPETYRQWHARKLRAGLVPLPAGSMIKNNLKEFV